VTKRKSRKKGSVKGKIDEEPEEVDELIPEPVEEQQLPPTNKNLSISDYPQVGELVVGTCTKITAHGAYFKIEGYEILGDSAGFVHISELSRTWVRNIRKHIREGQKTVARVMRISAQRQEIDLSIRRVNDSQKRETLQIHKQDQRARGILRAVGERLQMTPEQTEEKLITPLESKYGNIYSVLERSRDEGSGPLIEAGFSKEIADEITTTAQKELERPSVSLTGKVSISFI